MPKRKQPHKKARPTTPRADPKPLREWKAKFLECFAASGNVLRSAQFAGIDRGAAYKAFHSDEAFKAAWKLAEADAGDEVDDVARRNMEWENPVTYEGQIVFVWVNHAGQYIPTPATKKQAKLATAKGFFPRPLMEKKHDAALIALLCKARNPARFRDNVKVQHTGPGGGPVEIETTRKAKEVDYNALATALESHAIANHAHRLGAARIPANRDRQPVDPDHADG